MYNGQDEEDQSLNPIQILIDELKNDDIQLRLNSVKSLPKIAEALGDARTRKELIPFLSDSVDDEDEVLLVLAEQLGKFIVAVGGNEHAAVLLKPLESLAGVEEQAVRDEAIQSLRKIGAVLSDDDVNAHLVPLAKRLSEGEWYTSRVSASCLIPFVCSRVGDEARNDLVNVFTTLTRDDTPAVRRVSCSELKNLVPVSSVDLLRASVVPALVALAKDDQDSVRLLAVENAAVVALALPENERVGAVLPTIVACAEDKSWRVRYMVAEHIAKLCTAVGPELTAKHLVPAFTSYLKDNEAEVRTVAAGQVVNLCQVVPQQVAVQEILPVVRQLVNDTSEHVKASLAKVVMDLTPICGEEKAKSLLLEVFLQLLKDDSAQVRLSIISKLGSAVDKVITKELLSESLLPAIVELAEDKQWRVRLAIIEHIPLLAKQLGTSFFNEQLGSLCFSWLNDSVYSIREAATINLRNLTEQFGAKWAEETLLPPITSIQSSNNYLYRMTALFAIKALCPLITPPVFESRLLPLVIKLAADPVPNIRFNVAKAVVELKPFLQGDSRVQLLTCLKMMTNDADSDVNYYASVAIEALSQE